MYIYCNLFNRAILNLQRCK